MVQREWRSTGQTVEVAGRPDRIPDFDPRSGDHLWSWVVLYRADPSKFGDATHTPFLDSESLLNISGPGCFYCEQTYSDRLAKRRCPGQPRPMQSEPGQ